MKVCSKCQIPQPLENFSNNKNSKDGKRSQCKLCYKQWRENNKEKESLRKKLYCEKNKEIIFSRKKKYYETNKEHILLKHKQWYEENKDKVAETKKRYREINKEKIALKNKRWQKENREQLNYKHRAYTKTNIGRAIICNDRTKRRDAVQQGDITNDQLTELLDNSTHCFYCNNPLILNEIHIDHYIPLSKGGLHTITNLRIACKKCNLQKGKKTPEEFIKILMGELCAN